METPGTEEECCTSYINAQTTSVLREVPIGNCLLKAEESLVRGAQGPLSMSADGIQSASDGSVETLIECKRIPTFTGIGQLLIYSYFRKRDREVVQEWYRDRSTGWETKGEISGFKSHILQPANEELPNTYRPKPRLDRIDKQLVVCDLDPATAPILAGCSDLDIAVDYPESGRWRTLPQYQFTPNTPEDALSCESWVAAESRETLQSDDEESLAQEFCALLSDTFGFSDIQMYREVPIGSQLSATSASARRADLLIKADDNWLVVELKRTEAPRSTRPFLKGVGQASIYATLFAAEWNLQGEQVIPVLFQKALAILGGLYRRDRYEENYREMFRCARADMRQPVIVGPAATFGTNQSV